MRRNIIIVDNFYDNPDEIRNFALKTSYNPKHFSETYPGLNSSTRLYNDFIHKKICKIIGKNLIDVNKSGRFRISKKNDTFKQYIHFDPDMDWIGIVFLNKTDINNYDCGTSFYKHKQLKIESCPKNKEELLMLGYSSMNEVIKNLVYGDGFIDEKWEKYLTVPMIYNRMVLFRPWLWHSHSKNFGDTIDNSRLVQLFFYKNG